MVATGRIQLWPITDATVPAHGQLVNAALAGEVLFLQASLPNLTGVFGILVAAAGLLAFVRHEHE